MRIGYIDSRATFSYKKENIRGLSDTAAELQHEMAVQTSGVYTEANGNTTTYAQRHVGAPTVRYTPDAPRIADAVDALRNGTTKTVELSGVSYSESRIAGTILV